MIRVITDSVASIPKDIIADDDIRVLTLYVHRDGVEYADATMDVDAFYTEIYRMVDDIPTSSQPSAEAFERAFEEAAVAGDQILGVFISTGLSGCYDGALRAARSVKARHADFEYALVDSASCGGDEGFPVMDGIEAVHAGRSLAHAAQAVLLGIQSTRFLFTPESLTFLKAGGRIGNAAALLGNLVQLAPVLTVRDTFATAFAKARTRPKALKRIMQQLADDIDSCGGLKRIVVHYIGSKEPAIEWAKNVIEPYLGREVDVLPVSPVIGMHVGPAVGIAYECNLPVSGKITGNIQQYLCMH
jgi:DegV family protein with EDD domain